MNMRWTPRDEAPMRSDLRPSTTRLLTWLVGLTMAAAFLLGAASRDNLLQVSAVELASCRCWWPPPGGSA